MGPSAHLCWGAEQAQLLTTQVRTPKCKRCLKKTFGFIMLLAIGKQQ